MINKIANRLIKCKIDKKNKKFIKLFISVNNYRSRNVREARATIALLLKNNKRQEI